MNSILPPRLTPQFLFATFATGLSLLLLAPAVLRAQATATALSLGNVNVGVSNNGTVTFTFTASTTVTAVYVLSQRATNGDFQVNAAAPGTCAAATYSSGNTCTVGVTFTAGAPGTRVGAVELATASGPEAGGYAPLNGTGVGGFVALPPGTERAITGTSGFNGTFELASDQSGAVYVGSYSNGSLYKEVISGTAATQTTISTTLGNTAGIAVNGGGDIFVATGPQAKLYEFPYNSATGTYASTPTLLRTCAAQCWAVALDPVGNLFLGEAGNIYKSVLTNGVYGAFTVVSSSYSNVIGLGADSADNLYIADQGAGIVYKAALSNSTYTRTTIETGHTNVNGIAIGAAGEFYASDTAVAGVLKYTPKGSGGYTRTLLGSIATNGVTLTPGGVLYANNDNATLYVVDQNTPSSSTSSTQNYTSPEITVSAAQNVGNASLTVTSVSATSPFIVGAGNTCTSGTALSALGTCTLTYRFAPTAATTSQTGTLTLAASSNSATVNLTGNVSGTATKVVFFTPPATPIVAGGNPGTIQAILEDANSYYVTTPGASVSLNSNYNTSTSYGSAVTAANGGLATFTAATPALTTAGTYTYTAASTGLTSGTASEVVAAGAATQLTATPAGTTTYVGTPMTITVKALDQYGNQSTSTDTVSLAATPSTVTLPANFALSNGSGTGSVTFTAAGSYTVTAQDVTNSGVTQGTTITITVQAQPVFVVGTLADDASGNPTNCPDTANGGNANTTCTLRDAVAAANAANLTGQTGSQATITFAPAI